MSFKPRNFGSPSIPSGQELSENLLNNFSGLFSLKPSAKYMSGARCTLKVNGHIVAFAFEVGWNIRTEGKELWGIDNHMPQEIVPNKISIDGTISGFRIPGRGPVAELMQGNVLSFLFQPYITLEVRDSKTDSLLFYADRVQITNRSEAIKSEELSTLKLQWRAIGFKDEAGIKYPDRMYSKQESLLSRASNRIGKLWDNIKKPIGDIF